MTINNKADVVIIGGGVTGLSSAWWLARAGVDVAVIEKAVIGYEASSRNGGIAMVRPKGTAIQPLAAEGATLWPSMDEELGYPTEYEPGYVQVALDEEGLQDMVDSLPGFQEVDEEAEILDAATIKDMVPLISPRVVGGIFNPRGAHANPQRTVQAFAWAAQDHGARIYQHTTATGFKLQGDKVTAVETTAGDIETDFVISAAGPQTSLLAEMVGAFVPLAPFRPEIAVTAPVEPMWPGAVGGNGLYGRQTKRGNLAYGGGPHEWTEIDDMRSPNRPNTELIRNIARRIYELWEGAGDVPLIRSWACVVETSPDFQPIVDFLDSPQNYLVMSMASFGFGRSPATGKVARDLILHGETTVDIDGLRLGRFAGLSRNWREERDWIKGAYNT